MDIDAYPTTEADPLAPDELGLLVFDTLRPPSDGRCRISASNAAALENAKAAERLDATFSRTSKTAGSVGIKCRSRRTISCILEKTNRYFHKMSILGYKNKLTLSHLFRRADKAY